MKTGIEKFEQYGLGSLVKDGDFAVVISQLFAEQKTYVDDRNNRFWLHHFVGCTLGIAVKYNRTEIYEYCFKIPGFISIFKDGEIYFSELAKCGVQSGSTEVVDRLIQIFHKSILLQLAKYAAKHNQLHILNYILNHQLMCKISLAEFETKITLEILSELLKEENYRMFASLIQNPIFYKIYRPTEKYRPTDIRNGLQHALLMENINRQKDNIERAIEGDLSDQFEKGRVLYDYMSNNGRLELGHISAEITSMIFSNIQRDQKEAFSTGYEAQRKIYNNRLVR